MQNLTFIPFSPPAPDPTPPAPASEIDTPEPGERKAAEAQKNKKKLKVEKPGIDPGTSRILDRPRPGCNAAGANLLSGRSTI